MAGSARDRFDANIRHLFTAGDYSDLTISCGSDTYNVHKNIVCTQSEFFRRAEKFPGKEAVMHKIDLPEDDPALIKLLVQYLYEAEYEPKLPESHSLHASNKELLQASNKIVPLDGREFHYTFPHTCSKRCLDPDNRVCQHHLCGVMTCNSTCDGLVCKECCPAFYTSLRLLTTHFKEGASSQFLLHSQMYELADKYQVDGLKDLALEKFRCCCAVFWYTHDFPPAARHVFASTPDSDMELRDQVALTISKHMELLNKPDVAALLDEHNGLAAALLRLKAGILGWEL